MLPVKGESTDVDNLGVAGAEPVFHHIDSGEVPWVEVKRQRNADGTTSSVWERWLAFSTDPLYLSLYARYDPGMIVRAHGHRSPHVLFVLDGGIWCGERWCPPGTHVELPLGAAFGPFRAGEEPALLFEVMLGDPRSWGADEDAFRALLARHGVEPLPDPPIELPAGMADLREQWAAER